jgi:hypothetical protein
MMDHLKFAENHIKARKEKKFNPEDYGSPMDLYGKLENGRTYEFVLNRIEDRMINPFDVYDAHNGVVSSHYSEAVKVGFLLFTTKLKQWETKWQQET